VYGWKALWLYWPPNSGSKAASASGLARPIAPAGRMMKNPQAPAVKREAEEDWSQREVAVTSRAMVPATT
jgi:hypothetical protein